MQTNMGGNIHQFFTAESSKGHGGETREWDLNDWKWDGERFMAVPVNPRPLDCRNKQLFHDVVLSNSSLSDSEECNFRIFGKGLGVADKRRRIVVIEDDNQCDGVESLSLQLGGHVYPVVEEYLDIGGIKNGKRDIIQTSNLNYPDCQVEGCGADLSQSKDYHKRHKVCEVHAKAGSAVVQNVIQRFCQQCSRFHLLQEFDEGKRSCRRRLAGHNRRRRKNQPDISPTGCSAVDNKSTSYLLISFLRILANLTSDKSQQPKDNELLLNLLRNIASLASSSDANNSSGLLQASQDLQIVGTSAGTSEENGLSAKLGTLCSLPAACTDEGARKTRFDLNASYIEGQDGELGCEQPANKATLVIGSSNFPPWMVKDRRKSGLPYISGNTDSTSTPSPSSSNVDAQGRTDRIVFKLFGKGPNDFPLDLRAQIFDWLSHSPTDMESYIRPGCIILTVYLRLGVSTWDELHRDLGSTLNRLLRLSDDDFWKMGWIYARLQHHIALIYNGQVVLNKSLNVKRSSCSKIVSVTPIAVPPSSRVTFKVKGFNLTRSTTRLLCAFEGRYLIQETDQPSVEGSNNNEQFSFSCYLSDAIGRGFIEVEDNGLSSGFFPFVVAEENVCAEIRMLESSMDATSCDDVVNFLHEIGWLLRRRRRRRRRRLRLNGFSLVRFRWILRFSIEHDWSAVVKTLLDILFDGIIDLGGVHPTMIVLSENLLHYAVQRNSKLTVKLLLRYKNSDDYLFRPDMPGPSGLTPLHIAATIIHAETMLDSLTNDPGQLGVKAWRNVRDSTGFTPEDYAFAGGHKSYIAVMQKKINKSVEKCEVAVNMPSKQLFGGLEIEKRKSEGPFCKLCEQHSVCRNSVGRSLLYRPMLLSMVGIAAVCVCVGLLFKGPPEVLFVYPPFRWELLEYGFM